MDTLPRTVPGIDLETARAHGRRAAQWLELLRYRPVPGMWTVGPHHCCYAALVRETASDGCRLDACLWLLGKLPDAIAAERAEALRGTPCPSDVSPLDLRRARWPTTAKGAGFETAQELLRAAAEAFEAHGIVPRRATVAELAELAGL